MKLFKKKIGRAKLFGHINRMGIPYMGLKYKSKKGNSKSITVSPIKKNFYTKDKISRSHTLRTKTDLDSFIPKFKLSRNKK